MFNGKVDRLLAQFCYYIPRILRSLNPEKNRNHTHTDGNARKVYYTSYTEHAMLYEKSGQKNRRILQNFEKSSIIVHICSRYNFFVKSQHLCFWASDPLIDRFY